MNYLKAKKNLTHRMLRVRSSVVLAIILLSTGSSVFAQVLDKSVAVVSFYKTESVSLKKIEQQYDLLQKQAASITGSIDTSITKKDVLEAAINDILIAQAARAKGVTVGPQQVDEIIKFQKEAYGTPISNEDFQTLMTKQTGMSWAEYREQIQKRLMQEQYITQKYQKELSDIKKPSNAEILKTYDEYATMFTNPTMVRTEHLFWDTRGITGQKKQNLKKKAEAISAVIKRDPDNFDAELKKSLENPEIEGGDLGFIVRDDQTKRVLGENFLNEIFSLKENEVSEVIASSSGYHIVKLTDRRAAKLLDLDDPILPGEKVTVRERIISTLQNQYRQLKFAELIELEVDELRERSKIRILDSQFK